MIMELNGYVLSLLADMTICLEYVETLCSEDYKRGGATRRRAQRMAFEGESHYWGQIPPR